MQHQKKNYKSTTKKKINSKRHEINISDKGLCFGSGSSSCSHTNFPLNIYSSIRPRKRTVNSVWFFYLNYNSVFYFKRERKKKKKSVIYLCSILRKTHFQQRNSNFFRNTSAFILWRRDKLFIFTRFLRTEYYLFIFGDIKFHLLHTHTKSARRNRLNLPTICTQFPFEIVFLLRMFFFPFERCFISTFAIF